MFIFLLLILLALAGALFWYFQRNKYSKETLKLEVLSPEKAKTGEEVLFTVRYKNRGNIRLEDVRFIFEYPEGALPLEDHSQRVKKELEDIYPGEERTMEFPARLFGKKEEVLTARTVVAYRPKNIKAVYESESSGSTEITKTPLAFVFDVPSKVPPRKETKVSLNYYSNLKVPLSNVGVRVSYPSGFEFLDSQPRGMERGEWQVGLLNGEEGGKIEIRGKLDREGGEEAIFEARIGIWIEDRFVVLKEESRGVKVSRSPIVLSQEINGFTDYVAEAGELLHYKLFFKNIGDSFFEEMFLVSELEGPFDSASLKSRQGKINSENSVVWDWHNIPDLRYLGPGEEGKVEFWVSVEEEWEPGKRRYPSLSNAVSLREVEEKFETKVATKLVLEQKGYRDKGIFDNKGPVPPEVGKETTYTLTWEAENFYNRVENAKVKSVLPEGSDFTGKISPEEEKEKFTFDSESREIMWEVGEMEKGGGKKSVSFQVSITPEESQTGLVVPLTGKARFSGEDTWAGKGVGATDSGVDSSLPDDDSVGPDEGVVGGTGEEG